MPAKNINLLTESDFETTPLGQFLRWSLTYGRYIIVSTEIIVLLAFIYRFSLDRQITDLHDEIEQKSQIISVNQKFETKFRNLQTRFAQISTLAQNQDIPARVIRHLEDVTPTGITLETLSFSANSVSLKATADTNGSLSVFINNLKSSPLLSKVNVSTLSKNKDVEQNILFSVEAIVGQQTINENQL